MPPTTLVLGAGFTKGFYTDAPLMVGDYDCEELLQRFTPFTEARQILEAEFAKNCGKRINIERVLTRLEGRMPYDFRPGIGEQLALLLAEVKQRFLERLRKSISGGPSFPSEMRDLATYCIDHNVNIVTFNYDVAMDRALFEVTIEPHKIRGTGWYPGDGYGFPCPAADPQETTRPTRSPSPPLLLKLHGSVTWLARRGTPYPYPIDAIIHWWHYPAGTPESSDVLIENEPLIVPPVLVKSALTEQPVLREVWTQAYRVLAETERVVFVGYSMPVTDIGAKTLFGETLLRGDGSPQIEVVDWCDPHTDDSQRARCQETLRRNYRELFPELPNDRFRFDGARTWAKDFISSS